MDRMSTIWVTFRKEGVHAYPAALTDPKLEDVKFLGHAHRHIFHFRVEIEVFHDDREIEFIQFKRYCSGLYDDGTLELNYMSCEMLADELAARILGKYPGRALIVEVSEDGENGCRNYYDDDDTLGDDISSNQSGRAPKIAP